jgi:ABC-type nitrate/sulfonate/bicarbonate transport system substrate-binding protein
MPAASRTVRLVVFPGAFNWPVWVGVEEGFFARHGIALEITPTPGSVFQLSGLADGTFDLAITLIDNVVAYREGQGEVPLVGPDLVAVMAADTRAYPTLVTQPGIRAYADLRGKALSVDALNTGYALVLRAMLAHGGLAPGDYTLESVGGAHERYVAMLEGRHAGCLLNSPLEGMLESRGYHRLDTAMAVLGRYQGQVVATRRAWARTHRPELTAFLRGFLDALCWLRQPHNRDTAHAVFQRNVPGADAAAPGVAHAILFDPETGFPPDGAIDPQAVAKVIELRARFGVPPKRLGVAADYVDDEYLRAARA